MINFLFSAYRFSDLEIYLLRRLEKTYYLKRFEYKRWPEVYYIERRNYPYDIIEEEQTDMDYNTFNIDFLGVYVYNADLNGNSCFEGRIFLFKDRIERCAHLIADRLSMPEDIMTTYLNLIVLIHEFGHWYTHWCSKQNQKHRAENFQYSEKSVKETMAQLTVLWSLMKLNNTETKIISKIFDYLSSRQSPPYQRFKDLSRSYSKVQTIIKRYFRALEDPSLGINYLLYGKNSTQKLQTDTTNRTTQRLCGRK